MCFTIFKITYYSDCVKVDRAKIREQDIALSKLEKELKEAQHFIASQAQVRQPLSNCHFALRVWVCLGKNIVVSRCGAGYSGFGECPHRGE